MTSVSIVIIGDEILIGQVADTNSGWIARHVNPLGWDVKGVRTVGDNAADICDAIESAMAESDIVFTTGGLGPTKDDITKNCLLKIFGGELIHDKATEENVLEVVRKRGLKINVLTAAQADVPSTCEVIQNKVGTAPIMCFNRNGKILVTLPGVPFETETMMQQSVIPYLQNKVKGNGHIMHKTFIVVNNSESALAQKLTAFEEQTPSHIKLAYLPTPGFIRLRLTGHSEDKSKLEQEIDTLSDSLSTTLNDDIISYTDSTIESLLLEALSDKNYTLSTAESCTGGNIAHKITSIAGSSKSFKGGVVAYANEVKSALLSVSESTLSEHGAVSEEVVREMVTGACLALNTECSIATSGIAGPTGGTESKPVGTVWIATKTPDKTVAKCYHFAGNRTRVINHATTIAMIQLILLLRQK